MVSSSLMGGGRLNRDTIITWCHKCTEDGEGMMSEGLPDDACFVRYVLRCYPLEASSIGGYIISLRYIILYYPSCCLLLY